jgi:hypothetical protein
MRLYAKDTSEFFQELIFSSYSSLFDPTSRMMGFLEPTEQFSLFLRDQRTTHLSLHWIPLEAGEAPSFIWRTKQLLIEPSVSVPSKIWWQNLSTPGSQSMMTQPLLKSRSLRGGLPNLLRMISKQLTLSTARFHGGSNRCNIAIA